MALILQLETSTEVCSVAISRDGNLLALSESSVNNSHTEVITILIQNCLDQANITAKDIDAIAVSDGPGSYTSLRVGTATAKGICFATGCKLIAIDSLRILAAGIDESILNDGDYIIPMIDARRMEVYATIYDAKFNVVRDTDAIILALDTFDNILLSSAVGHICGSGATKFYEAFPSSNLVLHHTQTSAQHMSKLAIAFYRSGNFSDLAYYTPNYFKAPNITKSTKKLF